MKRWLQATTLLSFLAVIPAHAVLYSVTDLGTLGGATSSAFAVNNSGQVVGVADTATQSDAFLWQSGTMTDLGTLGGNASNAQNINNLGQVVGFSTNASSVSDAFLWTSSGGMTDIDSTFGFNAGTSVVYTITDAGRMVGFANGGPGQQPRYFDGTSYITIPNLGGVNGHGARGVNDSGQVAGYSLNGSGLRNAFLWTSGTGTVDLGTLGGATSQANFINASGLIVGNALTGTGQSHAFYDNNGASMVDMGTLGGANSQALKDNSAGYIVGNAQDAGGNGLAFLYTGGVMYNLNALTDSSGIGWTLQNAQGISDTGYIVGVGLDPLGQTHAFLLTPIPEPSSIFTLIGGLTLLGLVARRKILPKRCA